MVRVVVVEDSPVVREFLLYILGSDPEIEIVATAGTGEAALEAVERTRPDVVTMDVHMPKMNGLDATRMIMQTHPTPIVIVSGALDVVETASSEPSRQVLSPCCRDLLALAIRNINGVQRTSCEP
jgi:two-component system chemotaxis response regulator CheB